MGLFFITGNAGTGKSTLKLELRSRGYEAHDTDEGFAKWHHNETGYVYPESYVDVEERTPEFLKAHTWKVPIDEIKQLVKRAKDKTVFLCGYAANEDEIRDLFTGVFALVMDDETLTHRLASRTNNDWGKHPHELKKTLDDQASLCETYESAGHTIIDATLPLKTVADTILKNTEALVAKNSK